MKLIKFKIDDPGNVVYYLKEEKVEYYFLNANKMLNLQLTQCRMLIMKLINTSNILSVPQDGSPQKNSPLELNTTKKRKIRIARKEINKKKI